MRRFTLLNRIVSTIRGWQLRNKVIILFQIIRAWNWGVLIANLGTFLALLYSIYQNNQNDEENKAERNRINIRDSTQTAILMGEYKAQVAENKIQRVGDSLKRINDSTNLALYQSQIATLNKSLSTQNKGLEIQNQSLEVQRLSNRSNLILSTKFLPHDSEYGRVIVRPIFTVTNNGKSSAQNITVKYVIVTISTWLKENIYCDNVPDTRLYGLTLNPNQQSSFSNFISTACRFQTDSLQNNIRAEALKKLYQVAFNYSGHFKSPQDQSNYWRIKSDSLDKIYPIFPYKNYLVVKLSYEDNFQQNKRIIYAIYELQFDVYLPTYRKQKVTCSISPMHFEELPKLKKCIISSGFNYDDVFNFVKKQISETNNSVMYN